MVFGKNKKTYMAGDMKIENGKNIFILLNITRKIKFYNFPCLV